MYRSMCIHTHIHTHTHMGFLDISVGKESACTAGGPSLIPGWGRFTEEGIAFPLQFSWASPVAQLVNNPPAMQETWFQSLGWKNPLEKGKATHSSMPGEFHGLYSPWGCKESNMTEQLSLTHSYIYIYIYIYKLHR